MYEPIKIHISHDEARAELKKRWNNAELKSAIEKELGENFMPQFAERLRGVPFRQVITPDNGLPLKKKERKGDILYCFCQEKK
jgi:hypothetical protein